MRAASARVESHPPPPASPKDINPAPDRPGLKSAPEAPAQHPGRRRVTPPTQPEAAAQAPPRAPGAAPLPGAGETPVPPAPVRTASAEEIENDPLVRSVLEVFGGEIKRVHPKNP